MIGGRVIEAMPMTILAGDSPGKPTDVIRLWCVGARKEERFDETAVYAEAYADGEGPKVGDSIWWQAGRIMFDGDKRSVRKVGFSFDPGKTDHVPLPPPNTGSVKGGT